MTKLVVDLTDPEMAEMLADCAEGEEKSFSNVSGTLTKKTDSQATFEISDLGYSEEAAPVEEELPMPTKKGSKPAVAAALKNGY